MLKRTMTENWKPYLCKVNEKLASIFVNLGLRGEAPILSKPWLLWAWVYFQNPRADGLSDSKEAPVLYKIEDALNLSVSRACQAIPCGRITTAARREFFQGIACMGGLYKGRTENRWAKPGRGINEAERRAGRTWAWNSGAAPR